MEIFVGGFLVLVLGAILAMVLVPSISSWLEYRDEQIRTRPVPEIFRDSKIAAWFYPITRKNRLAPADTWLIWVIIAAVLLVIYEIFVLFGFWPEDDLMILWSTRIFVVIFGIEFVIRFMLKGLSYMAPWGSIDLTVILVDIIVLLAHSVWLATVFDSLGVDLDTTSVAAILRVLRVVRLVRAFKLVRYLFEKQTRLLFWRRTKPHLNALRKLSLIVLLLVFFVGSAISLYQGKSPAQGWFEIFAQVKNSLEADCLDFQNVAEVQSIELVDLSEECSNDPFALAASILVLAAIANMIAVLYAPIMHKIQEEQARMDNLDLLEGHVIILLNDPDKFAGVVEELIHVFNNCADKEVFFLSNGDTSTGFESGDRLTVVDTSVLDPTTWVQCAASSAEVLISLGDHDTLTDQDLFHFMNPSGGIPEAPIILFKLRLGDVSYKRTQVSDLFEVIEVAWDNLIFKIEKNSWSRRSLQFNYLHQLTDEFEDDIEFPDLSRLDGNVEAAKSLASLFRKELDFNVDDPRGYNILIDLGSGRNGSSINDDEISTDRTLGLFVPDELNEIRRLESIIRVLRDHPEYARATCVFAYVASFELIKRYASNSDKALSHLSIFAIEFAASLSVLHELMMPGIMRGWLTDGEYSERTYELKDVEFVDISNKQNIVSTTTLRKKIPVENSVSILGLIDADGRLTVATRSANRFRRNAATRVIVRSDFPSIDQNVLKLRKSKTRKSVPT